MAEGMNKSKEGTPDSGDGAGGDPAPCLAGGLAVQAGQQASRRAGAGASTGSAARSLQPGDAVRGAGGQVRRAGQCGRCHPCWDTGLGMNEQVWWEGAQRSEWFCSLHSGFHP